MLYRRQRQFPASLAVLIAAVVVFPLGFLIGRGTAPAPDLSTELTPSIYAVQHAQGTLDIVDLEYARAAKGHPSGTPQPGPSLTAARHAATTGLEDLGQAIDLARLYPNRSRTAHSDFEALIRAIDRRASLDQIHTLTGEIRADLAALLPPL